METYVRALQRDEQKHIQMLMISGFCLLARTNRIRAISTSLVYHGRMPITKCINALATCENYFKTRKPSHWLGSTEQ